VSAGRDGCEWVNVSSGTGLPRQKAIKRLCVCVCVCVGDLEILHTEHY